VVAQEANPPDQPIGSKVDRRPLADTLVTPPAHELLDLRGGTGPVEGGHVGEEIGLGVDLGERLQVVRPPLPEEQARRS
jgi:hypothetical protein